MMRKETQRPSQAAGESRDGKNGKVWLVGAGPSDAGLFTLRGKELLEQADVVVYDKLVGQGVMAMIPLETEKITVGKVAGHHPVPQPEINRILLEEAQKGKKVVRLKGGDPFVFGRGGEELELLCEHGIPFEIVPGITSAVSVPAYNGIPVTHRDFCSSLHIITGHTKKGQEPDIDFEALVRLKGTLVFLMGVASMPVICKGLREAGMRPDMPAAVLERGTTAHQRRVVSDISNLPAEAEKAAIGMPAIIIVGEVCQLAEKFHWAEDRELGGLKIAVTRPKDRSSRLAGMLSGLGAEVVLMPTVETEAILENSNLHDKLDNIEQFRWVAFTSPTGAKIFFSEMAMRRIDVRRLHGVKFAAIGPATARVIEEKGMFVDLLPETYTGEALGKTLAARIVLEEEQTGQKAALLLPRAAAGTEEVTRPLQEAGVTFEDLPVYETLEAVPEGAGIYDETIDYVAFTSASTVRGFCKLYPDMDYSKVKAVCIGQQTAKAAEQMGMEIHIAQEATMESMVDCLKALKAGSRQ